MGVRSTNPAQSFIDDFFRSGTDAVSPNAPVPELRASGGSTYFYNNKAIHVFTSPGTFASLPNWVDVDVEYVAVGGGGGGGVDNWSDARGAGGGGAGGYRTGTTPYSGPFSVPVSIGSGGDGASAPDPAPSSGDILPSTLRAVQVATAQ